MIRGALIAVIALGLMAAPAGAVVLKGTPYGAVDLGDRVPYKVGGKGCEGVEVVARVTVGKAAIDGPVSRALPRPAGGCTGLAQVPEFYALRAAGWLQGDPIEIALVSNAGTLPLRFARMEVDLGTVALGTPEIVPAEDQDTGDRDKAVAMDPGAAMSIGRVNLRQADALAVRLCLPGEDVQTGSAPFATTQRSERPHFISIRQDDPDGPPLIGPIDVAADPQELSRLSTLGFNGCYRLVVLPFSRRLQEGAPELFIRSEQGDPDALRVNSIDVAGTGAKRPPSPAVYPRSRVETIFNGKSFDGWKTENCVLRGGAAVNARTNDDADISGCSMTWQRPLRDVVIRIRLRREDIYDNAGVYLGGQEIQMRSMGEYLPGGYFGHFAARWQKLNVFPHWSEIEVIQLGARHVVSVNGRTVTDVMRPNGAPEEYLLNIIAQPQWSYRFGVEGGFGSEGFPDTARPNELGAFWFREVRLIRCAGPEDPLCRALADARRGQVPVPDGAPAAIDCGPRAVVTKLPRAGLRRLRATAGGRDLEIRRKGARRARLVLPRRLFGTHVVKISGVAGDGTAVRVKRRFPACV